MRISKDEWFMQMAEVTSRRGTCIRRKVGCIAVNSRDQVIATGYNGTARGMEHCIDHPCAGAVMATGRGLDVCEAVHAEMNAVLQCNDVENIWVIYTTTEPCIACTKVLLNTGCYRIVFRNAYTGSGRELWMKARETGTWIHLPDSSV